ncbi:MAG TPA: sucrose phosphorylase, partial [Lachnospiraceae bacterium]|nr:sucrose phosphorylase [Lachnospiraceae bacterium]
DEVQRPVVQKLLKLMEFRNSHKAFDGEFILNESDDSEISITRRNGDEVASLFVNLKEKTFEISFTENGQEVKLTI